MQWRQDFIQISIQRRSSHDDGRKREIHHTRISAQFRGSCRATRVNEAGTGFVEWSGDSEMCYEAGCKLFVDEKNIVQVLKGTPAKEKTTPEFRARWSRPWASLTSYVGGYQLPAQLPEAYSVDSHLILLGDSTKSELVAALQASELLLQVVDEKYPGPGKSLVSFAWSPFAVEKNVILIGATDEAGMEVGESKLVELARNK